MGIEAAGQFLRKSHAGSLPLAAWDPHTGDALEWPTLNNKWPRGPGEKTE